MLQNDYKLINDQTDYIKTKPRQHKSTALSLSQLILRLNPSICLLSACLTL